MLRVANLNLGELEAHVLEVLWTEGPLKPNSVHEQVAKTRNISPNTTSSALKRLYEKGLLNRKKDSHAYLYSAAVTRSEVQRQLMGALAEQFQTDGGAGFMAAFVDLAEEKGEETLKQLEQMIAAKLSGAKK